MRKKIIIGNWKMNKTKAEALEFQKEIESFLGESDNIYGIAAPFISLDALSAKADKLVIAAQNVHFENKGAFTGEVAANMLSDLGIRYCIIGHSERRAMFNDSDETVAKKAKQLFAYNITPILCLGETLEEFESGNSEKVIRSQVKGSLSGLSDDEVSRLVIAYEPIWAIGTGKSATMEIASNCCGIVRDEVRKIYGATADKVLIQYGGSVKPDNIKAYLAQNDIDGALIGGASLEVDSFKEIIKETK